MLQGKYFKRLIPVGIIIVLANVMWKNFMQVDVELKDVAHHFIAILPIILVLTFANLYCEMRKWKTLVNSDMLNHSMAFKATLYGICTGFLTPNKLGEFAGRALTVPKTIQNKASLMTFVGSGIQGTITACAGIMAFFFYPILPAIPPLQGFQMRILIPIAIAVLIVFLMIFKNPLQLKIKKTLSHFKELNTALLIKSACWALARYFVFSTQFVMALYAMGFQGDVFTCYAGVFLLYFIQSYIPFTAMGELGVRELLAVLIFGSFFHTPILAAAASLVIWIANVGIPVLIGAIHLRFFHSKQIIHG